jgi:hypothetical protein
MPTVTPMNEFAQLLSSFSVARDAARHLCTPNREDDDDIKMAIVGFSYHRATEDWSRQHYEFIRGRCEGELSDRELHEHGEAAAIFRAFACLALGALLGLRDSRQIDDTGFALGDAQLLGFMYAHLPAIDELDARLTMRCSEPGPRAPVAIHASRGPGR